MLPAVHLDHQPLLKAHEIGDVRTKRLLTAELASTQLTATEVLPHEAFTLGLSSA